MNDSFQLTLKPVLDRGIKVAPRSKKHGLNVVTKLDNGCHRMTYKQLQAAANQLSCALAAHGIGVGGLVSTFMWNSARHLILYYGVPCMGSVLHPLNIRLHPKELGYILSHAKPSIVFIDANLLRAFERVQTSNLSSIKLFVICGDNMKSGGWSTSLRSNFKVVDFDEFISGHSTSYPYPENLSEKSGALLCYTSGTTGNPKGVLYSHRQQVLLTLRGMQGTSGSDTILGLPPMFHAGGWGIPYICIATGARFIMTNTCRDFPSLLGLCLEEKCTLASGVPTMVLAIAQELKKNPLKYASFRDTLKRIGCGGTAIPAYVVNFLWKEWGIEITQGWGMTECLPGTRSKRVSRRHELTQTDEQQTQNQIIQGTFSPYVESKLVDPEDMTRSIPHDGKTMGELLIRGPVVTQRYFRSDVTDSFLDGQWFKTGDICTITPLDEMQIMDRSKDLIKSGGEWISSVDLENFVMKLDFVALACVVGMPHPKWDERPIVLVQLREQSGQDLDLLKTKVLQHVSAKYAKFQVPDDVLFWKEIPVSGTGKMSKRTVRDQLKKENYVLPSLRGSLQSSL